MPTRPGATYRLQINAAFDFEKAAALSGYLAELGVTHVYSSPYLQASPGSEHGYDTVDFSRVNEEFGGDEGHALFCKALSEAGLGQVLDVVPNHMAIGPRNRWWWDVLENGPASHYASYFDVDWAPPDSTVANKVLLPTLGDHYGKVIENGEIKLARSGGSFEFRYYEHAFPVAPRSLDSFFCRAAEEAGSDALAFIADSLGNMPLPTATDRASTRLRHRDKEVLRALLERLISENDSVKAAVDRQVEQTNASPDAIDALLSRQNYRLAYWRMATCEIGYRRFFDINSLIGLKMEDDAVFEDSHRLILDWLARGVLDGLRIDHPDGLREPVRHFRRLREAAPDAWMVAEKILHPGERLRTDWEVDGTTGYDFMNLAGGLFVDQRSEHPLTDFYNGFIGREETFERVAIEKKRQELRGAFEGDLTRLGELVAGVCERHRRHRDHTRCDIHEVLREVIACFPVYRTYIDAESGVIHDEDRRIVTGAIECASANLPDQDPELFDFIRRLLLLEIGHEAEFVMRFQQMTGPVTAKGVEDTAFYCYNRLISLNDVGGDPGCFGVSLGDFHAECVVAARKRRLSMLSTSTHDTKRSEDVRARISVLSEVPARWAEAALAWSEMNARHKTVVDDLGPAPDRNMEYHLYQALLGAWPIGVERAVAYGEKAAREAKEFTSWTRGNLKYETALAGFVRGILADPAFVESMSTFVDSIRGAGWLNSISQALIKLTAPGVPDVYQGNELWDHSLVDPDNRRQVDFDLRRRLLSELNSLAPEDILRRESEGLPKLWVTRQALKLRRAKPEVFASGEYLPLLAEGAKSDHCVAFSRGGSVITIAPRLIIALTGDWEDTALSLAEGDWLNHMTGETLAGGRRSLGTILGRFPVALLSKMPEEG